MRDHIRFDTNALRDDRREELIAWVKTFGVEPKDVRPKGLIRAGTSSYQLHLSKMPRDINGKLLIDEAKNEVVTEPLVIDIGPTVSWPGWLGEDA